jgi:hypothetical protein
MALILDAFKALWLDWLVDADEIVGDAFRTMMPSYRLDFCADRTNPKNVWALHSRLQMQRGRSI